MKYATLLALTATASASEMTLDVFNPKNFMKVEMVKGLMQSTKDYAKNIVSGELEAPVTATPVQWSQCADDKGVFTMDSSTAAVPDPLVKGQDVKLNLVGALSDDITLSKMHVHVTWNGVKLDDEDKPNATTYSDTLTYTYGWNVPSFAPGGAYDVTITGVDADGSTKDFCVEAKFNL